MFLFVLLLLLMLLLMFVAVVVVVVVAVAVAVAGAGAGAGAVAVAVAAVVVVVVVVIVVVVFSISYIIENRTFLLFFGLFTFSSSNIPYLGVFWGLISSPYFSEFVGELIELDDGKIYRNTPIFDGKNHGFL